MNVSLIRRLVYIVAIMLLLIPLVRLSSPATYEEGSRRPGGVLSQLRYEHQLSQANLGGIDPASEAMRMASLGLRGIAANLLWSKAFHYKRVEDFDALRATLNQITNLQPNFISVWEFQAHNLSYNISVEFDDYRYRYHWIKKGIDFLIEGTRYNRDEPRLLWNVGWYVAHKIGRADEHKSFRRLFREDDEFHARLDRPYIEVDGPEAKGPDGQPDNWLVGRLWFAEGQRVVDTKGAPLRGKSPLIFHSHAPMCLINYAAEIEKEGYLDEKAQYAWQQADQGWSSYGDRQIPTSWGINIRLNDLEQALSEERELEAQLAEVAPGVRERLYEEKRAALPEEQREAMDIPEYERTPEQMALGMQAESATNVEHREVAANAPEAVRPEARLIARRLEEKREHRRRINRYRNIVNYSYWKTRCEVEQTDRAIEGRRYIYEADQAWEKASFDAKDLYEKAWERWAKIMEEHPAMRDDVTSEDLIDAVKRYRVVIEQLGEPWPPKDFALQEMMRRRAMQGDPTLAEFLTATEPAPATGDSQDAGQADAPTSEPPKDDAKSEDAEKPAEVKPAEDKPADEKPAEEKPAEEKPAEEKPADEKPADEKPADEKPADEKPADEKPADEKPADEKPADEKPAEEKPAEEKPADEKPVQEEASEQSEEETGDDQPALPGDGGAGAAPGGGEASEEDQPEQSDGQEKQQSEVKEEE